MSGPRRKRFSDDGSFGHRRVRLTRLAIHPSGSCQCGWTVNSSEINHCPFGIHSVCHTVCILMNGALKTPMFAPMLDRYGRLSLRDSSPDLPVRLSLRRNRSQNRPLCADQAHPHDYCPARYAEQASSDDAISHRDRRHLV